jgi:uncharacterized protein YndB with AHSA1/START domain
MIEVNEQINAVRRQVGQRTMEAGEARTVTLSQVYDAGIDDVWEAVTSAERIPRWFLPVSGDLRLGGRYQLEGNAGGTIETCDPPRAFSATWEFGGDTTWVEVRLSSEPGGRTRFELQHIASVDDERWLQFGPAAVGIGWDLAFTGLTEHLATGAAVDPAAHQAWSASPAGVEFMTLSSQRWGEAHAASGADDVEAKACADRTLGFYTGG